MRPLSDDGGGSDEIEKRARQRLEAVECKHGLKLEGSNGSVSKSGKQSKGSSGVNGSAVKAKKSGRKRRREESLSEGSSGEEDTDWSTSVGSSSEDESDDGARKARKQRKGGRSAKDAGSSSDESSSDGLTSESEDRSRRHKTSGSREKKSGRRKEKTSRKIKVKRKRSHRSESARDKDEESVSKKSKDRTKSRDKLDSRHKERRSKHRKEGSKKKSRGNVEEVVIPLQEDIAIAKISRTPLQDKMDAREQQKAMIRHNAEMAKARLASGDMKRARDEQAEMQRLYGAVDWRAKKKLRSEKKRLERTIAAGNKLANLEEREMARMDAFRVALGLPTAEAQRQAEWRAEATRALAEQEATLKETPAYLLSARSNKHSVIGPRLPHRSPT